MSYSHADFAEWQSRNPSQSGAALVPDGSRRASGGSICAGIYESQRRTRRGLVTARAKDWPGPEGHDAGDTFELAPWLLCCSKYARFPGVGPGLLISLTS